MEIISSSDSFAEQEILIFSVCSESIQEDGVKNKPLDHFLSEDSVQTNKESAAVTHPTQHCDTVFERDIFHDNFLNSNANNTNNSFFYKEEVSEADKSQLKPEADDKIDTSPAFIKNTPIDSLLCSFSRHHKNPLKERLPDLRLKRLGDASRSEKDEPSSLFVCQIGGPSSSPTIQRIFTDHSKAFIMKVIENSLQNDFEIVSGKASQEVMNNLLPFEQFNGNCSVNVSDTDLTEANSSDEDFSHFMDIVESDLEEPPLPVEQIKREKKPSIVLKISEVQKEQTNIKISKRPAKIKTSKSKNLRSESKTADGFSLLRQVPHKKDLALNENRIHSEKLLSSNNASNKANRIRFECDICHNTFTSKYSVRDHILAKHPPSNNCRPYKCEKCPQAYVRKSSLNEHVKMTHSNPPKFPCPSCPKMFKRKLYLQYHSLRAHSNSKKYLCQHCGAGFALIFALNEHVNYHHSDEVFKCNDCHKVYKTAKGLVIHSKPRLQGPKPTCRYCKEAFSNLCSLQSHLHQAHEDVHKFFCRICEVKFTIKKSLLSHIKHVHRAVRNYPCPLCEKCFKNSTGVKVHLNNIHNQEKNFKCEICCHLFKTRQTYSEHKALKHPM